jgi:dTDP-4-dehydrorhamnose reductase
MNIAVLGSNGQLGLKIRDCSINYPNYKFIFVDIDELDITEDEQIKRFFSQNKFDVLINCAAYTAVEKAEDDIDLAQKINAEAPGKLAEICCSNNVKFIHISTDYVFDGDATAPYTEESECRPTSVYGKTKFAGEQNVMAFCQDAVIIRTSWLYSEYGNNFVKTILRIAKEKEYLTVVNDQFGTPTYAGDLANAILKIANLYYIEKIWMAGIYHYSNSGFCSWYDFANEILMQGDITTPVKPVSASEFPSKVKRPAYSVFEKSKIIRTFNLEIPHWKDSLKEMLNKYL